MYEMYGNEVCKRIDSWFSISSKKYTREKMLENIKIWAMLTGHHTTTMYRILYPEKRTRSLKPQLAQFTLLFPARYRSPIFATW